MASAKEANLNAPHHPHQNAIEAFNHVLHDIKSTIVDSRHNWDKHEPKMWSRAAGLSNDQLRDFTIEEHLVEVRSGSVSYGTIIFGKIRIPAVNDELGEGYIHVRVHDFGKDPEDGVRFRVHAILTVEGEKDADGHIHHYQAIQTETYPLEFFNE